MPCSPAPKPAPLQAVHVLAFDTSTERLAVALGTPQADHTRLAEGGAVASATLLPQVRALLDAAGLSWADIDLIAFGNGPGAFTGLRTACAVAQGLGLGLGKPLLPIDSLLIVAEDARGQLAATDGPLDIGVAMDARMDEVYAARYRWAGDAWQVLDAPALYTLAALADGWAHVKLHALAGSALVAFGARLDLPALTRLEAEQDRAAALLRLARHQAIREAGIDAALALPLYLRDKVALTTAEREAVKRAKAAAL
jgi:tRNA threonylcarbamoyladenosine biosynthesis protein TsaB